MTAIGFDEIRTHQLGDWFNAFFGSMCGKTKIYSCIHFTNLYNKFSSIDTFFSYNLYCCIDCRYNHSRESTKILHFVYNVLHLILILVTAH